jgi:hypothetical protein
MESGSGVAAKGSVFARVKAGHVAILARHSVTRGCFFAFVLCNAKAALISAHESCTLIKASWQCRNIWVELSWLLMCRERG